MRDEPFLDDFDGADLDTEVWVPHYLPMWSSRADSAATYAVAESELRLTIPPEQGLWCPGEHEPLRVSGIQSGVFSGPVGSTHGQQPFREGLVVRERQPAHWGWTPRYGRLEVRARMELSPRSMASVWLVGLEEDRVQCGEICLVEVFGDALALGQGIKRIRDPRLREDFVASRPIDVTQPHVYAVDWRPGAVDFLLDGERLRTVEQAPDYPMQLILAVFDFPRRAAPGPVPELVVRRVTGR
jgi:hypothetical protein